MASFLIVKKKWNGNYTDQLFSFYTHTCKSLQASMVPKSERFFVFCFFCKWYLQNQWLIKLQQMEWSFLPAVLVEWTSRAQWKESWGLWQGTFTRTMVFQQLEPGKERKDEGRWLKTHGHIQSWVNTEAAHIDVAEIDLSDMDCTNAQDKNSLCLHLCSGLGQVCNFGANALILFIYWFHSLKLFWCR